MFDCTKGYGLRGTSEIDGGYARYREDPRLLVQSVLGLLESGNDVRAEFDFAAQRADNWLREAEEHSSALRTLLLRAAFRRVRALMGLRELPKFKAVQIVSFLGDFCFTASVFSD